MARQSGGGETSSARIPLGAGKPCYQAIRRHFVKRISCRFPAGTAACAAATQGIPFHEPKPRQFEDLVAKILARFGWEWLSSVDGLKFRPASAEQLARYGRCVGARKHSSSGDSKGLWLLR
jgi:hypothetical protein